MMGLCVVEHKRRKAQKSNMKYQVTKRQCEKAIKKGYVCEGCGHKIQPMKTVDNSRNPTYWAGCPRNYCMRFTPGVPKNYFLLARKAVNDNRVYVDGKGLYAKINATREAANDIMKIKWWSKEYNIAIEI